MSRAAPLALLAGCASNPTTAPSSEPAEPRCADAPHAQRGPYAAGVTTLDVAGVPTEVWYPAAVSAAEGRPRATYDMRTWLPEAERAKIPDAAAPIQPMDAVRDLPLARGRRFRVVLFSHGLGGYRMQTSFLMTHLASWGFVVVAPEHVERGLAVVLGGDFSKIDTTKAPDQLRGALARMRTESTLPGGRFENGLELDRIAVSGHSMGGASASALAGDPGIRVTVLLASPGYGDLPPEQPSLSLWGAADHVATPGSLAQAFAKRPSPRRSIGIARAGHLAFTDLCAIGREKGGVLQIAADHGIPVTELVRRLGNDGCGVDSDGVPYLRPDRGWRVVRAYVTAKVRWALDGEPAEVGLDDRSTKCFGDDISTFLHE